MIIKAFVSDSKIITLTAEVVAECIKIRRSRKIKTPDAIMAANAIVHNLILVTSDNDFKNIDGLMVLNPSKL